MKYLLSLVFIFNISGLVALAQKQPPPPPPLIYKAPEKSELKTFISEDKTFQITFPGVPKVTKQEDDYGSFTSYNVYRQGSNSTVTVTEFKNNVENVKDKIYDLLKSNYLKPPKSEIKEEKDIQVSGKSGKEFDILQYFNYRKIRILIVGKRVYEIKTDVTNWHILNDYYKNIVSDFEKETDRFFQSFQVVDK